MLCCCLIIRVLSITEKYIYFCYFCISQENKEASISEIHEFVKKIPSLTLAHKILDQHINIAEKIKQVCGIIYCDSIYDYVMLCYWISYRMMYCDIE